MSTPISFSSITPRYGFPNLFSGQAQKDFYINEAHAIADTLLHPAVETESDTPPVSPVEGQAWLVGASPTGDWAGQSGKLASWQSGQWLFVTPKPGMRIQDLVAGSMMYFDGNWQRPVAPTAPSGGNVVDSEARNAIVNIIETLADAGIIQL